MTSGTLPIDHVLPQLLATLQTHANIVLSAPPGAGKTTRVPLALLKIIPPGNGRIIMLEPRRIAAVSAARYMAASLGEQVGQTVGYSIRFERRLSAQTRIEVVTEGILTRRLQEDPELAGVACIIFDEFHERSIHADLGLALCLEAQAALRPDLKLLVMSATLDCAPLAKLLGDAPILSSEGRSFAVDVRYLPAASRQQSLAWQMAGAIRLALRDNPGDLLAFLPGSSEIRAVQRELDGSVDGMICPLYGDLPFVQQQQAIQPGTSRRVVLATNIAETSLTINGVQIVVDSGLSRRLQFDPGTGLERLVTVRASRASALQRTGRAGRTGPGVCYRLYGEQSFQAMTPFTPPEILTADLAPLVLELAAWGATPEELAWLDQPPAAHLAAARVLLQLLGALDRNGAITRLGRRMVRLPLHPRLARLLIAGQELQLLPAACRLAAELSNRPSALTAIEQTEQQLLQLMGGRRERGIQPSTDAVRAPLLILAWPDRIARRRPGDEGRYLLASGRGAVCRNSQAELLVALQVDGGDGAEGVIHQSAAITVDQLRQTVPQLIIRQRSVNWDQAAARVSATEQEQIRAVVLSSRQVVADDAEATALLLEQVRCQGVGLLGWSDTARQLQSRVMLAYRLLPEEGWPDLSDTWLSEHPEQWLASRLSGLRSQQELGQLAILTLLQELLGWRSLQLLDSVVPVELAVPSGRHVRLDYTADEGPVLSVKLQELFGLAESPLICRGRRAVLVHLLSPAGRPVAVTRDLRGFWGRGYQEVRKELRGRYPKHPWPDDPWNAVATHRTKKALENA
ncbi:ATP-dependent helicase HrpB [Trichlorobacter lovleyi]|uniref:ATP-dependent helicase HrpB n=1 Tax=Trichlorobacter lovleyi TaxID=313985 RepID=UPI002240ABAD|nr:ATP-dependent helicase HrpB [Trichlorobacter lovleyi]QOX78817.1 ATP-dependent helicase HrpB [Trichlorobacter lovleyi]